MASHAAIYLSADNYLEIGQPPLLNSHRCPQTIQTSCGIQSLFICARCVCSVPPSRVSNLYVVQLLDVKTDIEEFRRYMGFSAVRGICWLLLSDRPISWRELNVLQSYAPTGRVGKSNIAEFEFILESDRLKSSQQTEICRCHKNMDFPLSLSTLPHRFIELLLAPSGALKIAPGRYPTIPTQSTYSFQCSISFNYDQKGYKDRYKDRNKDRHKYRLIKVNWQN